MAETIVGVAFIAGASSDSSSFTNNRSWLRARGYVDYPAPGRLRLTDLGREIAEPTDIPRRNADLHALVLKRLQPAVARMLKVLIDAYPRPITMDDLALHAGASSASSSFTNNRSWLRARGLAEYPSSGYVKAADLLFPEQP